MENIKAQLEAIHEDILKERDRFQKIFRRGFEFLLEPPQVEVGATPAEVVYEEDRLRLWHYRPIVEKTMPVPLLIVYALVNRHYVMDLQPDRSIIQGLLHQGIDPYIIDWGYPGRADRYLTLEDYIEGYLDNVIDFVRKRHRLDKINLMGVCQGGTFCVIYAALYPEKIHNLITMVTPVKFNIDRGLLFQWIKEINIDRVVDNLGNVPGEVMNLAFLFLNPFRLMFDKYVGFWRNVDDPKFVENFLRMEKWIFDSPDQAGEALRKYVKDLFQGDLLIQNRFKLGGKEVDLQRITMPLLNIFAEYDHLVPPEASRPLNAAVGSADQESLSFRSGHIGLFVSSKTSRTVSQKLGEWLIARSGPEAEPAAAKKGRSRAPKPTLAKAAPKRKKAASP